jgi:hypothetical protein
MHTVPPHTAAIRLSVLFCSVFLLECATLTLATKPVVWCVLIAALASLLTPALVIPRSSN